MDLVEILREASNWDDGSLDSFGTVLDPLVGQGGQINLVEILHEASKWDGLSSDASRAILGPLVGQGAK